MVYMWQKMRRLCNRQISVFPYHKQVIVSQLYKESSRISFLQIWLLGILGHDVWIIKWITLKIMTIENLEVEDDGPDETKNDGRTSVNNVSGVDVHQLDLGWNKIFKDKIR